MKTVWQKEVREKKKKGPNPHDMYKSQLPRWPRWKQFFFCYCYFSDIEFVNPQYTLGPCIDFVTVPCLKAQVSSCSAQRNA
jgi:hypothetical protein